MKPVDVPDARTRAAILGESRYSDGKPCAHGHVAQRYTRNGYCVICQREATKADRARIRALLDGGLAK